MLNLKIKKIFIYLIVSAVTAAAFFLWSLLVFLPAHGLVTYPPGSLLQPNDVTSSHIRNSTIINEDVSSTAAIAYSKLNLTNSILDSDVSSTAAIAATKIATSSANQFVTNGAQTWAGVKTFSSIPVLPSSDPSTNNEAVRKSYVDAAVSFIFSCGGSGGSITYSSNTTLTQDVYATDLTINASVVVSTAGHTIYVCGTFTNNGTIQNNGGNGGNGGTGSGGAAGAAATGSTLATSTAGVVGASVGSDAAAANGTAGTTANPCLGVAGVAGGNSGNISFRGSGSGGAAGACTSENLTANALTLLNSSFAANATTTTDVGFQPKGATSGTALSSSAGSGSGSAGPSDAASTGGGGGGSGGTGGNILIVAKTFAGSGTIQALGGSGGNGGNGDSSETGGGGGGGGGSGGVIVLAYKTFSFTGTISVAGGTGGIGGSGNSTGAHPAGYDGNAGAAGNIYRIVLP